jgi:large subunit ribosomal protein L4
MPTIKQFNTRGEQTGERQVSDAVFGVAENPSLLYEAVRAQRARARVPLAHTKTRGEVRGGGRKPWRQKGTGRARHGSSRSPIWVGGGIVFGPNRLRSFALKINRRARRKALCSALSDRVREDRLFALEDINLPIGKTKTLAELLGKLPCHGRRTLLILDDEGKGARRFVRNLPAVASISAKSLNVYDVLRAERLVATVKALEEVEKCYGA